MTFKEKVKTFVANWAFVYNFFFRPWVIKNVITETLTGLERQNYESQIRHQKMIVQAQVLEFKNIIAERDALWARLQEAREARQVAVNLLKSDFIVGEELAQRNRQQVQDNDYPQEEITVYNVNETISKQ